MAYFNMPHGTAKLILDLDNPFSAYTFFPQRLFFFFGFWLLAFGFCQLVPSFFFFVSLFSPLACLLVFTPYLLSFDRVDGYLVASSSKR